MKGCHTRDRLRAMKLSVILCTHNPRLEYRSRTLEALRSQTVPRADWELMLIDNRSAEPLASRIDLSWALRGGIFARKNLASLPRDYVESRGRRATYLYSWMTTM
jgi:hypothetical protein